MTTSKITNEKLYTKDGCNLIFTIIEGADTSDLKLVNKADIKVTIKAKGLSWANRRKVFMLDAYNKGGYTDQRMDCEVC